MPVYDRRTYRQTDGRTHDDSIYRASIASRNKNGSCDPDHAHFKGDLSSTCLDLAYLYTKFENSSVNRSRDMVGADQNLRDMTTPLSGIVCHPPARTCCDQPISEI